MRISDWSSDVCSSDLARYLAERAGRGDQRGERGAEDARRQPFDSAICGRLAERQQRRGIAPRRNRDEPDGSEQAQCERRERRGGFGYWTGVVEGKRVVVRVDLGGHRHTRKKYK